MVDALISDVAVPSAGTLPTAADVASWAAEALGSGTAAPPVAPPPVGPPAGAVGDPGPTRAEGVQGPDADDEVEASARQRWLGRGGVVAGGAASLAVGAVLGGALQGVTGLLAPPVTTGAIPQSTSIVPSPGGLPLKLASAAGPAQRATPHTAARLYGPQIGAPSGATATPTPGATGGSGATPSPGATHGTSVTGTGGVGSTGSTTGGSGAAVSVPPASSACDAVCSALQAAAQGVSQAPAVGGSLAGAVSQVGATVSGAGQGLPGLPAAPAAPGTAPVPSGPVSGVTSTVGGLLSGVGGAFGL
jgi:hypothetical protein